MQNTVYTRFQTDEEALDAEGINRMYTEYSIYLDHKKIKGSLKAALQENFTADSNHVSEEERETIRQKMHAAYMISHPNYKEPP